ncbi:MAG: hypothetical protein LBM41_01355 [Ruminococcus sp.]|jgi:hypothetical protein|nr:hypothetical protein [Ruminococcus sp.]
MAGIGGLGNPIITAAGTAATTGTPQRAEQVNLGEHAIADMSRRFDRFEKMEKTAETKKGKETEYECRTCANRKYVDGSSDSGVSFQTPTQIDPQAAQSAVRAHENEHVTRNAAKAEREGMEARSTVAIHMAICPECGRSYVAGGTTTTTYTSKGEENEEQQNEKQQPIAPIGGGDKKAVE